MSEELEDSLDRLRKEIDTGLWRIGPDLVGRFLRATPKGKAADDFLDELVESIQICERQIQSAKESRERLREKIQSLRLILEDLKEMIGNQNRRIDELEAKVGELKEEEK